MSRKLVVLAAAAALLMVADANAAGSVSANVTAQASVVANCSVVVTGVLDFGTYDPVAAGAQAGSGASLDIQCTRGSHPMIAMGNGANFGANASYAASRAMITAGGGANKALAYDLLQPDVIGAAGVATVNPWGVAPNDFDAGVWTVSPTTVQSVKVFGSIPAGQDVSTGSYTDTVSATVNF